MSHIIALGYPGTLDADGICASQTPAAAGNLTLDGALVDGGIAHCGKGFAPGVTITSDDDDSGVDFTITGTSVDATTGIRTPGDTEVITGPNATAVTTTKYFESVTGVSIDGAGTGSITVGVNATSVFAAVPLTTASLYQFRIGGTFGSGTVQLQIYDHLMAESINFGDAATAAAVFNAEVPVQTYIKGGISGATGETINILAYPICKTK
jgi:hypothetical protein